MIAGVERHHVLCAIGNGTAQVWASARAGLARIAATEILDQYFEPISMGLVPADALAPLPPVIDSLPLPPRARRLLQLAVPGLVTAGQGLEHEVPLFMGLPEPASDDERWMRHVPAYLRAMTDVPIDTDRSVIVPKGRAAALEALALAMQCLERSEARTVLVGGADSFMDEALLKTLDAEKRILSPYIMDGFIPGEGAAFYRLSPVVESTMSSPTSIVVHGAATAYDSGHRYGDAPARGEGLAFALERLRQRLPPSLPPAATVFSGMNGESFDAKLWGVASIRHRDLFTNPLSIEHPADKFGDTGAAVGAILVAMTAAALSSGSRRGPAFVWAASDRELRGCAMLSSAATPVRER